MNFTSFALSDLGFPAQAALILASWMGCMVISMVALSSILLGNNAGFGDLLSLCCFCRKAKKSREEKRQDNEADIDLLRSRIREKGESEEAKRLGLNGNV